MDTAIFLAHNAECAKSTAAYEKVVMLASLMEKDREVVGHSFYYAKPEVGDARLLGVLDTMLSVVGQHVPELTQHQWAELLSLVCNTGVVDPQSFNLLPHGLDYIDASAEDLAVYRSLQPIEWFVVSLVSNRIFTVKSEYAGDLSHVIAEYTGEPAECVFADDPDIGDAWDLKRVKRDGKVYTIHWVFVDGTDAQLTVDNSDPKYWTKTGLECQTSRHLAPRNTSLSSFLFAKSLPVLDEIARQEESEGEA